MTKKIDWKQELLDSANFNKKYENLLNNCARSLTESWLLGLLYIRWKKLKSIREQTSEQCHSSLQEWDKQIEDADK